MADRPGLLENIPARSKEAKVPAPRAESDGSRAGQAEEHQAALAWLHLRFWRKDTNVLARVRESLLSWSPGPTGPARLHELAAQARAAGRAAGTDAIEVAVGPSLFAAVPSAAAAPLATPLLAEAVLADAPWTVAVPAEAFLTVAPSGAGTPAVGSSAAGSRAEVSSGAGSPAEGCLADGASGAGSPASSSPAEGSSAAISAPAEGCPAEGASGAGCPAGGFPAEASSGGGSCLEGSPAEGSAAGGASAERSSDDGSPAAAAGEAPAALPDAVVAAVRETFAIVARAGDEAAGFFYGWLFAHYPRLRDLFPPAMNDQRDRLVQALVRIVESLTTPEEMAAYLAQLGRDHRKYGVEPAMYEAVGDALLATLRVFAGPAFTPAAEQAWKETYEAISALMIKAAEDASALAPAWWAAEVVANDERYRGISVLTIAPDQPLPFQAGQHITVQTPRWPRVWRPYSIAGCPRDDGLIQLHVRAIPGGWVSNALVDYAGPGQMLTLGPPLGTMTLAAAGDRDLLCVAGGTGLSPVKAIIEQAVRDSAACPRQIYLFCGARRREELYDLPDLWRLADAWPGLNVIPVTSDDPAFDGVQGNVGRVAARYLPHGDCEAYVAGPPAMVRETIDLLGKAGLPRARIHFDDALLAGSGPAGCSGHQ
jgi:NAD(P)H-flavin reductase/hemoglobin-like flavoprotein